MHELRDKDGRKRTTENVWLPTIHSALRGGGSTMVNLCAVIWPLK